jgi:hypothetical protein
MMSEHSSAYTENLLDSSRSSAPGLSLLSTRIAVFSLAGLTMGLAWAFGAYCFETIAVQERIVDLRASQVTTFFGYWMAALWVTGIASVGIVGRGERSANASFVRMVSGSSSLRRFTGAVAGLVAATFVVGAGLLALASLTAVIVTPPAAWLILTLAGILLSITAVTRSV